MGLGSISAVIDSLEFDTGYCYSPHIIHISGDVFAVAYVGVDSDGWLCTFTIDSAGAIGATVIDTLEFDTGSCEEPRIIHISGDVYAIAYEGYTPGVSYDGVIKTMTIDSSGNIGAAVIATLTLADQAEYLSIIQVSGSIYAVTYEKTSGECKVVTITINTDGTMTGEIDTLQVAVKGSFPEIIHISGTTFAIVYQETVYNDGFLVTLAIETNGQIGAAVIDTLEFDEVNGYQARIVKVLGNVYAIAYTSGISGKLCTVTIGTDGVIADTIIASLVFDTTGHTVSLVNVGGSLYAVAYQGVGSDGWLATFAIASDGAISSVLGTLEFDTAQGSTPSLIKIGSTTILAVAYYGVDADGWVKTAGVSLVGELSGVIAVVQTRLHYLDAYGVERWLEGTAI